MRFELMKESIQFSMAKKAMKKLYPSWRLFIDQLMDLLEPFWLGTQSREEVHFIHLIGYGKRQKAREILTELLELLDWQMESIQLWDNWDLNGSSSFSQVVGFQESFPVFPKVVVTDFFIEFFAEAYSDYGKCEEYYFVENFLRNRKELNFIRNGIPSDARGGLVISYLNSFGDSDFTRTRLIFQFLWENPLTSFDQLRIQFLPEALERMIELGYVRKEELVFFSKDEPRHILLAFELISLTRALEEKGQALLGVPVSITMDSMDYFIRYVFHKDLSHTRLHQVALDFFLPVFSQYRRMARVVCRKVQLVEVDFAGSWKLQAIFA